MGGLVIRHALAQVELGHPNFPHELKVKDVLMMGTPHDGTYLADWCHSQQEEGQRWEQCNNMRTDAGFIRWLANYAQHPDPQDGVHTDWTVIGSRADIIVPSKMAVWMAADHKVGYHFGNAIAHSDYMHETSANDEADVEWRDGSATYKDWFLAPWPVRWAYYSLSHSSW